MEGFEPRRTQRDRRERPSGIGFKSRTEHSRGRAPSDLPLAASRVPSVAVRPPRDALSGRVSLLSRESRSARSEGERGEPSTTRGASARHVGCRRRGRMTGTANDGVSSQVAAVQPSYGSVVVSRI